MPNATLDSGASSGGIGSIVGGLFGSNAAPKPKYFQFSRGVLAPATRIAKDVLGYTRGALPRFQQGFEEGTGRQLTLQNQQADVLQGLLQRRLANDPQQQLRETGNTLFSFIDPNVIAPLARADVNRFRTNALARGLDQGAFDSTANRLRDARISSGRMYDVARDVYTQLPRVFQQLRDAGVTDEMIASGLIPQIQRGYRDIDLAPLIPIQAGYDIAGQGADLTNRIAGAERASVYGFHQPINLGDRFARAGQGVWNTVKDAAQIYAQLYGGGALGGIGGAGGAAPTGAVTGATAGANAGFV